MVGVVSGKRLENSHQARTSARPWSNLDLVLEGREVTAAVDPSDEEPDERSVPWWSQTLSGTSPPRYS